MIENLIISAKKGDDQALFQLLSLYQEQLYRIAYSYLKNEDEALEAIQETTCRVYRKRHQLKEPAFFKTWVIRILINYCVDEQKRRGKLISMTKREEAVEPASPIEEQMDIQTALTRLQQKQQEVIRLKYFEDMTIKEIAAVMGCPEGTVKINLHRGLQKLRELLKREGEIDG